MTEIPASTFPAPPLDDLTRPYWDGLASGELRFQRCSACGNAWLPAREECPRCWLPEWTFEASSGIGVLVSWVVYHKAYHPYFRGRLPYNVAIVELKEGPRLLTNILYDHAQSLAIGRAVRLEIQEEGGWSLARFRLCDDLPRC